MAARDSADGIEQAPSAPQGRFDGFSGFSGFSGMGGFCLIWAGQLVTLLGTGMVKFAFIVRAWSAGEHATTVVGLFLAAFLPKMLVSPVAGALVDRWSKKVVMQMTDLGGLVAIGALSAIYFLGHLQLWHIYVALALAAVAEAFQYPAFSASIPLLVPREKLQRASGMMSTAQSITEIGSPSLAGILIGTVGLGSMLVVDTASFAVAIATIVAVAVADDRTAADRGPVALWSGSAEGLRYLWDTRSLRALTMVFLVANVSAVFGFAVLPSMILARSGNDSATWAVVSVCTGIGGILGGLAMAALKTPRSRIRVLLLAMTGTGLVGQSLMATGRNLPLWCAAELGGAVLLPIVNGMLMTMLQTKVPRRLRGRVFGSSMFLAQCAVPLAFLLSGPLADHVFEPAARTGSGIPGLLAPLIGRGPGTGMAAMLFLAGIGTAAVAVAALGVRSLRNIDTLIPDLGPDADPSDQTDPAGPVTSTTGDDAKSGGSLSVA